MLPLIRWLSNSNLEDVYRKVHTYKKEFTWSNGIFCSRIDYIWASSLLSSSIMSCKIVEAECIIGSDHKIVLAKLVTGIIQKAGSLASIRRMKGKKRVLKLDKA